jgi:AbiV family abortive infection protein
MSQFINLSIEESGNTYPSIFKNALQLKKDARTLAENNKSFSSANSLLILSFEEVVKSIVVFLHSEGFDVYKIKTAKKIFSDHSFKHSIAQIFEIIIGFSDMFLKYKKIEKSNETFSEDITTNTLLNLFVDFRESATPMTEASDRSTLIENFNINKNKGLYTDYRNELQISSQQITEKIYNETLEVVERLFRFYRSLIIQFHPNAKSHLGLLKYFIEKDNARNIFNVTVEIFVALENINKESQN